MMLLALLLQGALVGMAFQASPLWLALLLPALGSGLLLALAWRVNRYAN